MFASEVVREWEIAWLQIDDRVGGDRPLRLVGEKRFCRNPRVDQSCRIFRTLREAGVLAFPRGDELTIENHIGDILMALCCIVAIVYEFSHITPLRKSPSGYRGIL